MSDREALIHAYQSGRLLEAIQSASSAGATERTKLASELAALHNEGVLDLLATFGELTREGPDGRDFFLLRDIFEQALPELEAAVAKILRTVLHLYQEAGDDLAAGTILSAIQSFYAKSADRPRDALAEIEANAQTLDDLLVTTLIAGSATDATFFLVQTLRLCRDASVDVKRRALYALGKLKARCHATDEAVINTLEHTAEVEVDDGVLASTVGSAFELSRQPEADQPRFISIMARALDRGTETTQRAAAQIFGFRTPEISPEMLHLLLDHLVHVNPANRVTIDRIDYGIHHLLEGDGAETGLAFLEKLLRSEAHGLDFSIFDDTARTIRDRPKLRSKVATRWLLGGDPSLCQGLLHIFDSPRGDPLEVEADSTELAEAEAARFLFAARKAIGYLFLKPISAASFILSLMRQVADASIRSKLGNLLLNPLLLNFTGAVSEHLKGRLASEPDEVRAVVQEALDSLQGYLEDLESVGSIPALLPTVEHRSAYRRHFSEELERSFEKAQAESVLLPFIHQTVVLYGRKAIHHVFGPKGQVSRMETHLGRIGTEIEIARMTILDPLGLEFMLHVFRHERAVT